MVNSMTGFENATEAAKWGKSFSENFATLAKALRNCVIDITNNVADLIADILPVALPVLGIAIAVFFGIKFIKKVMK